jgi:hypothetical protein
VIDTTHSEDLDELDDAAAEATGVPNDKTIATTARHRRHVIAFLLTTCFSRYAGSGLRAMGNRCNVGIACASGACRNLFAAACTRPGNDRVDDRLCLGQAGPMGSAPRLVPLLAQLDTSLALALERMEGLTDAEYLWMPSKGGRHRSRLRTTVRGPAPSRCSPGISVRWRGSAPTT